MDLIGIKEPHSGIADDNKKLINELEMFKRENEILKKERDKFIEENKSIKRNVSLQEDGVIEYQTVNYRQATKIKKLKEKINYLKGYIAQVSYIISTPLIEIL